MRESIGGAWLFQFVIGLMLIFFAFLLIAMNYARAFKVKNEIINIIENYEGLTTGTGHYNNSISIVNNYLEANTHIVTGRCPEGSDNPHLQYYGIKRNVTLPILITPGTTEKFLWCIKKNQVDPNVEPTRASYTIVVFLKLKFPIVENIATIPVKGETYIIQYPADSTLFGY